MRREVLRALAAWSAVASFWVAVEGFVGVVVWDWSVPSSWTDEFVILDTTSGADSSCRNLPN